MDRLSFPLGKEIINSLVILICFGDVFFWSNFRIKRIKKTYENVVAIRIKSGIF